METEERIVLAQSVYTPSCEMNLQLYRGIRRTWRIVLLCLLYGALRTMFPRSLICRSMRRSPCGSRG